MNLFSELKRRNVFKVAAMYAVVGWLIIQVMGSVADPLGFPDWIVSFVIVIVGLGFPMALVFAWAFELTPDGLKKTTEVDVNQSVTQETGQKINHMIIAALIIGLGYFIWESRFKVNVEEGTETVAQDEAPKTSIAVLPFVNMSDDEANLYFSDGISEEILNVLAKIKGLHVTSRSSAFQFRGNDIHIPTVANELGVKNVLEGSVRKSGTRVRITAQLIEAETDKHLWSETYDRNLDDIFAIQDEISAAIVEELKTHLGIEVEVVELPKVEVASNSEAHEAYLRGRYLVSQRTNESVAGSVEEFKKAIELDPDYGKAYAELALAYMMMTPNQYGDMTFEEARDLAKPYADRALALSPDLPEAQAAIGFYHWKSNSLETSLLYFNKALDLNPNYADVQNWISSMYIDDLGLYKEGEIASQKTLQLNPLSIPAIGNAVFEHFRQGELGEAEKLIKKMDLVSPQFYGLLKGELERTQNNNLAAMKEYLTVLEDFPDFGRIRFQLYGYFRANGFDEEMIALFPEENRSFIYRHLGDYEKAREISQIEIAENPGASFFKINRDIINLNLGNIDDALEAFEKRFFESGKKVTDRGLFAPNDAFRLRYLRLQKDPTADVSDLLDAVRDDLRRKAEAGWIMPYVKVEEGTVAFFSGEKEQGLELIYEGVQNGAIVFENDVFNSEILQDPGFQKIREFINARRDIQRAEFQRLVCGNNPYSAYWQPQRKTCEGFNEEVS